MIVLFINFGKGQFLPEPHPAIGWNALKNTIKYPENYQRALANGYADVTVQIDSLGRIEDIQVFTNLPLFSESIKSAFRQTKWVPAKQNGKNINSSVNLFIHFLIKNNLDDHVMIIEGAQ